jgi:hypothetical protein
VLYVARKINTDGGLSGARIGEGLQVVDIEPALLWLLDKGVIETDESKFQITDAGIEYLIEELPKSAAP